MTKQEIIDKAPDGATHYDRVGYYLKYTDYGWFIYSKLGYGWSTHPFILSEEQMELYQIKPL